MTKQVLMALWLAACATPDAPPQSDQEHGTLVRASVGGTVTNGGVTLVIPPGSLSEDTTISIEADVDAPSGDADGFTILGRGFKFSPPGTHFALAKPAVLTMPFDATAVAAQALDGRTVELAYFDEEIGRYFSIGGEIDGPAGRVTARVEHFTTYVAMAASLLPGNNAPTVTLQSPIPALIRADSPVYLRATIRDYDVGGSVAGANLHYRSPTTGGDFITLPMTAEVTLDTFGALIPAADVIAGESGVDLEYFVTAVDNLGAPRQSTQANVDLTRTFAPGTLVMSPATPAIAAGFERTFAVQARDELNTLYALVPETSSATNGVGETSIGATGVTFRARTVGAGAVSAGFGTHLAILPVTVFNGALDRVAILDRFGLEIEGTLVTQEGKLTQLDALGFDAYGNQILVNPTWATQGGNGNFALGGVDGDGLYSALDGGGAGAVTATIGAVTGSLSVYVQPRFFNTSALLGSTTTAIPRLATRGTAPYLAMIEPGTVRVHHRASNGAWVDDGMPDPLSNVGSVALAASANRVQVAWYDDLGRLFSSHLEGNDWVRDGGNLVVDPDTTSYLGYQTHAISLAFDGETPYLASWESNANGHQVFVRHWNGSEWVLDGSVTNTGDVQEPTIAILDGIPYVALVRVSSAVDGGADVQVFRRTGTTWEQLGATNALSFVGGQPAISPVIKNIGGKIYIAHLEPGAPGRWDVRVMRRDGFEWTPIMNGIINDFAAGDLDLEGDGEVPYLVWTEVDAIHAFSTRRVAHFNAQTGYWGQVGQWTQNNGGDALACAITIADGVPYTAQRENSGLFQMRISALQ